MVIFIIERRARRLYADNVFTFQYGYIYYLQNEYKEAILKEIYIPIWLYLLLQNRQRNRARQHNLHSNMVIFIIAQAR